MLILFWCIFGWEFLERKGGFEHNILFSAVVSIFVLVIEWEKQMCYYYVILTYTLCKKKEWNWKCCGFYFIIYVSQIHRCITKFDVWQKIMFDSVWINTLPYILNAVHHNFLWWLIADLLRKTNSLMTSYISVSNLSVLFSRLKNPTLFI